MDAEANLFHTFITGFFSNIKAISITFYIILCLTAIYFFLTPKKYESNMQILVQDSRENPSNYVDMAGGGANQGNRQEFARDRVTSEIELLSDEDIYEELALFRSKLRHDSEPTTPGSKELHDAAKKLRSRIQAKEANGSNIINVKYRDSTPELAQQILRELQRLYIAKHLRSLRPAGAAVSFAVRATEIDKELEKRERDLTNLHIANQYISLESKKTELEQQQANLQKLLLETTANEQSYTGRQHAIQKLLLQTPQRIETTNLQTSNASAIQQITVSLLELKNKRTLLASRYQNTKPAVRDLDMQIAASEQMLRELKLHPPEEISSDLNPAWTQLKQDYNQVQATIAADASLIHALVEQKAALNAQAAHLLEVGLSNDQLERSINELKNSQKQYAEKRQDEQLQQALDQQYVGNVTFTMPPTFSRNPVSPDISVVFGVGALLETFCVFFIIVFTEFSRSTFNTPAEIEAALGVSVLMTIPDSPRIHVWSDSRHLLIT